MSGASANKPEIIKVLIADDIPETQERLQTLLAFEADMDVIGIAATGREAIDLAQKLRPDVILMDINMPDMDGLTATREITATVRTAAVVVVTVQDDRGYWRQAMIAGARDYLIKPIDAEDLYEAIRNAYKHRPKPDVLPPRQSDSGPMVSELGHVIVVYGPQGGVGTTTLATNIAAALIRHDTHVLLIDCNLQFGDVHAFLDLKSQHNISDLIRVVDDLDRELINNILLTHGTGLKVLIAPPYPEQAYDISSEAVQTLVRALARSYDFVVVDTPPQFDDLTLKLFEVAGRIVIVGIPTVPSIMNVRKVLDSFDRLDSPSGLANKVIFVLNQVVHEKRHGRGTVPIASIQNLLGYEAASLIPKDDHAVLNAVNLGVPLVTKKSRSPGRELMALADHIRQSVNAG